MLIRVAGCEAFVDAVVAPVPLLSVRHDNQSAFMSFPARLVWSSGLAICHTVGSFAGTHRPQPTSPNLSASLGKTRSTKLKNRRPFNRPSGNLTRRASLLQEYEAMRIDLVELHDASLHADGRRCVEVRQ
jgi:hypothetical protein